MYKLRVLLLCHQLWGVHTLLKSDEPFAVMYSLLEIIRKKIASRKELNYLLQNFEFLEQDVGNTTTAQICDPMKYKDQ